jgi:arylsulfatase A-like enzyme
LNPLARRHPPRTMNGIEQHPIDGVSFAYTLGDSKAKGRLLTQYFEIMGSRAIYRDGWIPRNNHEMIGRSERI